MFQKGGIYKGEKNKQNQKPNNLGLTKEREEE